MTKLLKLLIILAVVSCSQVSKKDNTIVIKGKIKFPEPKFAMTIFRSEGFDKKIIDTIKVNADGTFNHTMTVENPGVYNIDCQKWQRLSFWAEDEDLDITFRGKDTAKIVIKKPKYIHINGGKNNDVMNFINFLNIENYEMMIGISQTTYKSLKDDMKKYQAVSGKMYDVLNKNRKAYVKHYAKMFADRNAVIALLRNLHYKKDKELIEEVLSVFEKKNPNYAPLLKYKKDIKEKVAAEMKNKIGSKATPFSFPTPEGKKLGLNDFKGKYLLVDFWASWCGPCRHEIPNIKKVYTKFKDKEFDILSVSIDKSKEKWLQALKEEGMEWSQIQAPESGKQVMKDYQFSGIPYIILLDKEGKIIAKNLRGDKLAEKLGEIFK